MKEPEFRLDFETNSNSIEIRRDPLYKSLKIPNNRFKVLRRPRESKTKIPEINQLSFGKECLFQESYFQKVLSSFSNQWVSYKWNDRKYYDPNNPEFEIDFEQEFKFPSLEFEIDRNIVLPTSNSSLSTLDNSNFLTPNKKVARKDLKNVTSNFDIPKKHETNEKGRKGKGKGKRKGKVKGKIRSSTNLKKKNSSEIYRPFLKGISPHSEIKNINRREVSRIPLFKIYNKTINYIPSILDTKIYNNHWVTPKMRKIVFKPLDLKLSLPKFEPFFCNCSLYDLKRKRKLTENFYFEFLSPQTKLLLSANNRLNPNIETTAKSALFPIKELSANIWLIIRVEKILQNDYDTIMMPYLQSSSKKNSVDQMNSLRTSIAKAAKRHGSLLQPFCWTAFPISFDGKTIGRNASQDIEIKPLFRSKDMIRNKDIFEFLTGFKQTTTTRRQKMVPGHLKVRLYEIDSINEINGVIVDENLDKIKLKQIKNTKAFQKQNSNAYFEKINSKNINYNKTKSADNIKGMEKQNEMEKQKKMVNQKKKENQNEMEKQKETEKPKKKEKQKERVKQKEIIAKKKKREKKIKEETEIYEKNKCVEMKICKSFTKKSIINPNLDFSNLLYLYPLQLKYSSRSQKTLALKIQFKEDDESLTSKGTELIFGKVGQKKKVRSRFFNVQFQQKSPSLYDEIKLELPINLKKSDHILFTLYSATKKSIQKKKKNNKKSMTLIGHAILPLIQNGKLLESHHTLPIFTNLTKGSNYLNSYYQMMDNLNKKNKKNYLKIQTKIYSTVYPQNKILQEFFQNSQLLNIHPQIDPKYILSVKELINIPIYLQIQYFEIILNIMFEIFIFSNLRIRLKTFKVFINFIYNIQEYKHTLTNNLNSNNKDKDKDWANNTNKKFKKENLKKKILKPYLDFNFSFIGIREEGYFFEELLSLWINFFKKKISNKIMVEKILKISWFLFELIIKSIIIYLEKIKQQRNRKNKNKNIPSSLVFSTQFIDLLKELIKLIQVQIQKLSKKNRIFAKKINNVIGLVCKDLLNVLDPCVVYEIIYQYISTLDLSPVSKVVSYEFKFEFFKKLAGHEYFVQLNLPILDWKDIQNLENNIINFTNNGNNFTNNISISTDNNNKKNKNNNNMNNTNTDNNHNQNNTINIFDNNKRFITGKHFLIELFLFYSNQLFSQIELNNFSEAINYPILLIRELLNQHENNLKNKNKKLRTRIATLYFPLVITLIDKIEAIQQQPLEDRKNVFVSILFILKNLDRLYFKEWWNITNYKRKYCFFQLLIECINCFKYLGKKKLQKNEKKQSLKIKTDRLKQYMEKVYNSKDQKKFLGLNENNTNDNNNNNDDDDDDENKDNKNVIDDQKDLQLSKSIDEIELSKNKKHKSMNAKVEKKLLKRHIYSKSQDIKKSIQTVNKEHQKFENFNQIDNTDHKGGSGNRKHKTKSRRWKTIKKINSKKPIQMDFFKNNMIEINNSNNKNKFDQNTNGSNNIQNKNSKINMINLNQLISTETSRIIIDLLFDMLNLFSDTLLKENVKEKNSVLNQIFEILILIFNTNQSDQFIILFLKNLRYFIHKFKIVIFKQNNHFLGDLCREIFFLIFYKEEKIRKLAITFLYLLIKIEYENSQSLDRIKINLIRALHKFVGNIQKYNSLNYSQVNIYFECLFNTWKFQSIVDGKVYLPFKEAMFDLIENLNHIFQNIFSVNEFKEDSHATIDLLYHLSNQSFAAPNIRKDLLENIYNYNKIQKNYAEAGMVQIHIAAMISEYLYTIHKKKKKERKEKMKMGKGKKMKMKMEDGNEDNENEDKEDEDKENKNVNVNVNVNEKKKKKKKKYDYNRNIFRYPKGSKAFITISKSTLIESYKYNKIIPNFDCLPLQDFNEKSLIRALQLAIINFQEAKLWEKQRDSYKILNLIFKKNNDYKNLIKSHQTLKTLYDKLIIENYFFQSERPLWQYFRIAFFGKNFGENNGVEYVYKIRPGLMISEVCNQMKQLYEKKYGVNKIKTVSYTKKIEMDSVKDDDLIIQIHMVHPHFNNKNADKRLFQFQKVNGMNTFIFDTPYIVKTDQKKKKGEEESVTQTFSLQSILKVKHKYPHMKTRQKIISHTCSKISPIELSIRILNERTRAIKTELTNVYHFERKLQQLLSGTLLPQVNEGIMRIANQFLTEPENFLEVHITNLKAAFTRLMKTCGDAIYKLQIQLKGGDKNLINAIASGYTVTKQQLDSYLLGEAVKTDQNVKVAILVNKIVD
ncbi:dedicator of cytokinesis dock [Anaeramoeba flamelloides]|uniref:Dedicator of cytokinesis dock n=1 Tax=Anaeramoeba flamelloides TaxID=1746091 RepID=A0ABQ8XNZ2_9EUKA|nr:dedicator of cytokinesis dock [Anaeramoeba flamelloides]